MTVTMDNNARKRVAFEDPEATSRSKTPSQCATLKFESAMESLLPAIITLAKHWHDLFMKKMRRAHQQSNKIERFASDAVMPNSAKLKFQLGATVQLKETPEFKSLANSTQQKVEDFQAMLKKDIKMAAELELKGPWRKSSDFLASQ